MKENIKTIYRVLFQNGFNEDRWFVETTTSDKEWADECYNDLRSQGLQVKIETEKERDDE